MFRASQPLRVLLFPLILLAASAVQAAAQFTTVTGSNIDAGNQPAGVVWTLCFAPSGVSGKGFRVGTGRGQASGQPICRDVQNGVLLSTLRSTVLGPMLVADTSLSSPVNLCYVVTLRDDNGNIILGGAAPYSGYGCVQPAANNAWCSSGTCNFDTYTPDIAALPLGTSLSELTVGLLNITECNGCTLPSGSGNEIVATPANGSSGPAGLRGMVSNDVPALPESAITNLPTDLAAKLDQSYNPDWNAVSGPTLILNKPTIPAAQVNSDWNAVSGVEQILNKPTIPAAQIQSDWNETNSALLDFIKNKPTIPAAQVNSDWNALSGVAQILNKPTSLPPNGSAGGSLSGSYPNPGLNLGVANAWTAAQAGTFLDKGHLNYDIMAYGAVCDGATDDSTAIQSVISTATTAGGGTVLIPGNCAIGTTLTLPTTIAVNLKGSSSTNSVLTAISPLSGDMVSKADGAVTQRGYIRDLRFNCNQVATTALEVISYRQISLQNLFYNDCLGTGYILGTNSVITNRVGFDAFNVNGDNTNLVSTLGASARPNYGVEIRANASDSTWNVGVFNHIAVAGVYLHGDNNRLNLIHVWGYGPNGTIANTWPQFGFKDDKYSNIIDAPECDTVQTACVDLGGTNLTLTDPLYVANDSSLTGSTFYLVQVESGSTNYYLKLWGGQFQGSYTSGMPTSSPIHWLGTTDTASSAWCGSSWQVPCSFGTVITGNGTASAPGFAFAGDATTGFYLASSGNMDLSAGGFGQILWTAGSFRHRSNVALDWYASGFSGSLDTGISRSAGGTVAVGNGTQGDFTGDIKAAHAQVTLSTPGSSGSTCTAGQVWADASYVYVCTASSTIKRVALSSF